ncbi:MAG TPA: TRAP transporter small permease subunit [Alphaproteobacteria bacterium]|nr:TRAP transporter small permease subunit [Alphaproteobacteria bacterium]
MTPPCAPCLMDKFIAAVDALSDFIGRTVSWLLLFMVITAVAVALLRYVFSIGFVWMQESYLWMHGALMMLGASYALRHDAHVRVDVFYSRMPPRRRAMVDIAGVFLFLLPMVAVIFYVSLPYVAESWQKRESSFQAGGLPGVYVMKTLIPVFCILLGLQGLSLAAKAWKMLKGDSDA